MATTDWAKLQIQNVDAALEASAERAVAATEAAYKNPIFTEFVSAFKRFYIYSLLNQSMIAWGRPDATRCASKAVWASFGRTLKPGAQGAFILLPRIVTVEKGTPDEHKICVGFKGGKTWPYEDTEGKPLPEEPKWYATDKNADLEAILLKYAGSKNIKVEKVDSLSRGQGYSSTRGGVVVLEKTGTSTLVHELAHQRLHNGQNKIADDKVNYQIGEVEAETVAFLVCDFFGVATDNQPNYLANWQGTGAEIRARLDRITKCAKEIIEFVRGAAPSDEQE